MLLSEEYRKQLEELHRNKATFGSSSCRHTDTVERMGLTDVLDYGCGKGNLGIGRKYDPAIPEYAKDPDPADLVVCTDVLEHIEPECLEDVLKHIQSKCRKKAFFVISTRPAKKILPDGRNAHLIIQPSGWWVSTLSRYFSIESTSQKKPDELIVIARCNDTTT